MKPALVDGLPSLLTEASTLIDTSLEGVFEAIARHRASDGPSEGHDVPEPLVASMRYALMGGGKRLRPALVLGGARAVGGRAKDVLGGLCAVEMVHAYSLVHDDLPALDNDDLRRGKASCHKQFGEAAAILTGDALLTEAMVVLTTPNLFGRREKVRARDRMRAARELFRGAGAAGMIGGQLVDLTAAAREESSEIPVDLDTRRARLRSVHRRKTGRLIQASVALGGILLGAEGDDLRALRAFGADLGLAFQLIDDVLDNDGLTALDGTSRTQEEAAALTRMAIASLDRFGARAEPLRDLAQFLAGRTG